MAGPKSLIDQIKELVPGNNIKSKSNLYEPELIQLPREPEPIQDQFYSHDPNDESFPHPEESPHDIMDPGLMQQPSYEENQIQLMSDIASDESLPTLIYFVTKKAHIGEKAQARLIVRASAFQSKNQVFSNIKDIRDYQMAQDDYQYAELLSEADFTCFDLNSDYYTAKAVSQSQFNIRIRRSRNALNLLQLNTTRQESGGSMGLAHQHEEKQGVLRKLSFLSGGGGGGY